MKAVLLALALSFSLTASAQQKVYSVNIGEWYASPTSEFFVFQQDEPCLMKLKDHKEDSMRGGWLIYHGKKQTICWKRNEMSFFGIRDDNTLFNIPWWHVFPRRMA